MRPLRVLHVIGGDDTGGAMSYLLPMLSAMRSQGCDARLLCLGAGGLARAAAARGLPQAVLPMSNAWDTRVIAPLRRFVAEGDWDVVHGHGMRANLPLRLVLPTVRSRPLLFTTVHSDLVLDYTSPVRSQSYAIIDRLTRRTVDGFCCVSKDLARSLEASGVPRAKIHVVHPGIEVPQGLPGETVAPRAEASEERPPEAGVVGTVARLVAVKDLCLMLEAAAVLGKRVPGARVLVVGDGPERESLERRAAENDLRGKVEFLGKVEEVWSALARFDVFVMTSEYEGVPISLLEAMSMGIPVVATAVGGVPEAVDHGTTGFLVERQDDQTATAVDLAARIEELLLDPQLRKRMAEAGRIRVTKNFSSRATGRKMLSIYGRALAGAGRPRD